MLLCNVVIIKAIGLLRKKHGFKPLKRLFLHVSTQV
jgi:hypothetical protein